jgi:regulatory protein
LARFEQELWTGLYVLSHGSFCLVRMGWAALAGTITSLQYQKRAADRVNVYLDGQYAFALPDVVAASLHIGQFLSDADIAQLEASDTLQKAYDRAVRFLSYRPRSIAEVRQYLSRAEAGYSVELIEAVVTRLSEQGYLNDAEFARFWVDNRQRFRPKGERALRQELRQRGLESDAIEAALADVDALEAAQQAARPRAERLAALAQADPLAFRRKLTEFLLRRGFGYNVAEEVVAALYKELTHNP